jgi:hypothetical protein
MNKEEKLQFIKKVESLVKPKDVQTIAFFSDLVKLMPKKLQRKWSETGNKDIPYLAFVVDPYSFFLAYKITNTVAAQEMLPEGYELVEASFLKDGEKYPMVIASVFTARTSAFAGIRAEFYIVARNKETGLVSWIISEYDTNTNSHDPAQGFGGHTADPAVFTLTDQHDLIVDVRRKIKKKKRNKNQENGKEFILTANLKNGEARELDYSLWIEGNLSVDYGGDLKSDSKPFPLIFDPEMLREGIQIPIQDVKVSANTYLNGIIDPHNPVEALVFPFTQHFIVKQDAKMGEIKSESDLESYMKTFIERTGFKTMKGDDIKKPVLRSMFISNVITVSIIIFLLYLVLR